MIGGEPPPKRSQVLGSASKQYDACANAMWEISRKVPVKDCDVVESEVLDPDSPHASVKRGRTQVEIRVCAPAPPSIVSSPAGITFEIEPPNSDDEMEWWLTANVSDSVSPEAARQWLECAYMKAKGDG